MPWFRWKKEKRDEPADAVPQAAAVEEAPTLPEPALPEPAPAPDAGTAEPSEAAAPKRKRRRGSRGGRGRKKTTAQTGAPESGPAELAPGAGKPTADKATGKPTADKAKRRGAESTKRSTSRRRQPPRRAPLPAAKRELVISVDAGEQRVAVLEDDKVAEVYLERPERRSIAGNIYLGVVDNVLPGMEAAFVEIGLEKNGFLYVDEIVVPELEGKRHGKRIQDLISRGEEILVQAVKDPMKTKGARLTTEISLPGRFLVYVPNGEGLGVSRRLEDGERQRLKEIIKEIAPKQGGVIVRTAADGASAEDVERDLVFLERLWKHIQARTKESKAAALVYQEAELPLRIVRDLFAGDFVAATIDHERTYRRIVGYLKKTSPHMVERAHRYKEKTPLFEAHGIDKEIESTLDRRVDLPSGGYLIFDYAEAFTVIDVNTGRFVGSRSKSSAARLEDTITKNNLEAVTEVVRQLRLRDIGGIIVIDFIDMANPKNRALVEEALRTELERDRTKTYVVEISPLGLVEMTRQKVTEGPREILTRKCEVCHGNGVVVSDQTVALEVERKLRALAAGGSRVQAYRVAVHPRIRALLAGPGGSRLAEVEDLSRRRFYLVEPGDGHVHIDHFEVLDKGKRELLAPDGPVEEGVELSLKLAEVDRFDRAAAIGTVGGVEVVVANAASLVGKKAKVVPGRVLAGTAYAALADGQDGPGPITFESEAEKPTRAPAKAKTKPAEAAPAGGKEPKAAGKTKAAGKSKAAEQPKASPVPGEPDDAVEPESPEGEASEPEPETLQPRKKTRRGSRGGRKRRKPAVAAGAAAGSADAEPVDAEPAKGDAEGGKAATKRQPKPRQKRTPKIHVPGPDAGENGGASAEAVADEAPEGGDGTEPAATEPKKRKARRGSRGGRGRKKKPVAANAEEAAASQGSAPATVAVSGGSGYVPMSEWIDELER